MMDTSLDDGGPRPHRLAIVALAGDPTLRGAADGDLREPQRAAQRAAKAVLALVREGFRVVVVPPGEAQLDCELVRGEEASTKFPPPTLAEAVAAAQATIGLRLETALRTALRQEPLGREVASLVTQILVAQDDPAFDAPSRALGPLLPGWRAKEIARSRGVQVIEEAGKGWRRVAATPVPVECLGLSAIEALLNTGHIVLTAAGGGTPVAVDARGQLTEAEAVVDEVQVAALIANELAADLLVLANPTEQVSAHAGQTNQTLLEQPTRHDLRALKDAGAFADEALSARIAAALDFLDAGGEQVILTVTQKLTAALAGRTGTRVTREVTPGEPTQQISLFAGPGTDEQDGADHLPTPGGQS